MNKEIECFRKQPNCKSCVTNGARYILITQSPRPGYGFGDVNIPVKYAEEWIKNGVLAKCGTYNNTALPLYRFVKEV